MEIRQLHLKIQDFLNLNASFDENNVNVIYGKNESGKTSILLFFRYLLFPNEKKATPWYLSDLRADTLVRLKGVDYNVSFDKGDMKVVPSSEIFSKITGLFDFETFKNTFAITQEELFEVEYFNLLRKRTDLFLGISGFSYSNNLSEVIKRLNKDIDKLYKQRGKKPYLNQIIEKMKIVEKEIVKAKDEIVNIDYDLIKKNKLEKDYQFYRNRIDELKSETKKIRELLAPFESYMEIRNKRQKLKEISERVIVDEGNFKKAKELKNEMENSERIFEEKKQRIALLKNEIEKISYEIKSDLMDKFKRSYFIYGEYNLDELLNRKEGLETKINEFFDNVHFSEDEMSSVEVKLKNLLTDYKLLIKNLEIFKEELERIKNELGNNDENELRKNLFFLKKRENETVKKRENALEKEKITKRIKELEDLLENLDVEETEKIINKTNKFFSNPLSDFDEKTILRMRKILPKIRVMNWLSILLFIVSGITYLIGKKEMFLFFGVALFIFACFGIVGYFMLLRKFKVVSFKDFLTYFKEFEELKDIKHEDVDKLSQQLNEAKFLRLEKDKLFERLKELSEDVNNLEKIEKELYDLENEINEINQKLSEIKFLKKEYEKLKLNLEKINASLTEIEREVKNYGFDSFDQEKILQELDQVKKWLNEKKELDELIDNVREFELISEKLRKELNLSENISRDELLEFVEKVMSEKKYKFKLESEYNILKNELIALDVKIKSLMRELKNIYEKYGVITFDELEHGFENYKNTKKVQEEIKENLYFFEKRFGIKFKDYFHKMEDVSELELKNSLDEKIDEMEELEYKLQKVIEEIGRLDEKINFYINKDILHEKEVELERLKNDFKTKLEDYAVKNISLQILNNTLKRYEEEYQPEMLKNSSKYFSKFTNGKYEQIRTNIEGNLFVVGFDGKIKDIGELSAGTKDQLYLALRLGYIDMIDKELKFPLFFDEVTANFDDERERNFVSSLKKLNDERQVFLFTCKNSFVKKFEKELSIFML